MVVEEQVEEVRLSALFLFIVLCWDRRRIWELGKYLLWYVGWVVRGVFRSLFGCGEYSAVL